MLAGMFLIFAFAGTFGFKELIGETTWATNMAAEGLLIPAAILLFGGAVGKSAQFPLNEWLLEAMTGPTAVSALIHAATMVKAGVFLVARLGPLFFALGAAGILADQFFEIIAWVGAFTALLLATQGMVNPEIKKVLAYSTGSQIGYMMMALGIAGLSEQFVDGYTAGFFHLISHAMFKASLFMAAGSLLHVVGSRFMTDMGGLRKQMKKTYAFMWAAGLALMGAPFITTGFWSKDAIFAAVYESGNTWALPIFIIAVLTAVITAFYTTRMIGMVFFGKNSKHIEKMEKEGHHIHEAPKSMWIPYGILAVLTIGIGIIGLSAEEGIHELFTEYLEVSFGIHSVHHGVEESILPGFLAGLNPVALGASLIAFASGFGLGYIFYIGRWVDPVKFINSNIFFYSLHKIILNRWYLNAMIYWGFVVAPLWLARGIWRYFERTVIDMGMNMGLERAVVMIEISSTPLIILGILGTVGISLPLINIARKEQGSTSFYGAIAFAALLASIGFVIYQFISGNVAPSAIFSEDVLVDDAFGGLFAIAMLIVAIMTTVGSFNYMKNQKNTAVYFSLILLSAIGMVFVAYSTDLVMLFVAWELMSIPTYILAGYMKKDPFIK
jgi:NADH-quinone oxidoreductase subunit L